MDKAQVIYCRCGARITGAAPLPIRRDHGEWRKAVKKAVADGLKVEVVDIETARRLYKLGHEHRDDACTNS
jgi:hypothetical protein